MKIVLEDFDDLQTFSKGCEFFEGDIEVMQGRYHVSGRSFLGLSSLDFSQPIDVKIIGTSERVTENFYNYLRKWKVKDN